MTEEEWHACQRPGELLRQIRHKREMRKRRLFACACCRRVWQFITDRRSREAVELAEEFADHLISGDQLAEAHDLARSASSEANAYSRQFPTAERKAPWKLEKGAAAAVHASAPHGTVDAAEDAVYASYEDLDQKRAEIGMQCDLIRDIFGNPFRPSTIDPDWLTWNNRTVPKLAQTIYDGRRYDIMPILADALEEAGCSDAAILDHCRGPGPHVRGCWVVDLILGKE
jgi:hypothetical protein